MSIQKSLRYIAILLPVILNFSCARLPQANSYWDPTINKDQDLHVSGYDERSAIRYTVSNDDAHLYFTFTTLNPVVERSISRNGVMLYVSTKKKESKDIYLKFPLPTGLEQAIGQGGTKSVDTRRVTAEPTDKREYTQAMWVKGNDVKFVKTNGTDKGFMAQYDVDATGNGNYRVAIPFSEINEKANFNSLTIGLEIETPASNRSTSGNNWSGGHGQGTHGGHSEGYGGRGMHTGGPMNGEYQQSSEPVKIWFSTKPAKS